MLRLRAFSVGHDATWVEGFFGQHWKDFKLYEMEKEEAEEEPGTALKVLAARCEWRGDAVVLSKRKPSKRGEAGNSLLITVFEIRNPSAEMREESGVPEGDVISSIVVYNFHVLE